MTTMNKGEKHMWKSIEYATAGKSHIKAGLPCQDKVRTFRNGEVTVITLADGAGSAKLSHYGAEAVLEKVSRDLGECFEEFFREKDGAVIRRRLLSDVNEALERVQKGLHCKINDLSSTLLAVAVSGNRYFIVHIGDGVIGYLKDGEVKVATRPDNGDFANETFFTTSPAVSSHIRLCKGTDEKIEGFVLMSDGTENALYNKRTGQLSNGIKRIMKMTAICPRGILMNLLDATMMESIMEHTHDDCSISILANTDAFHNFIQMSVAEKLDILNMTPDSRNLNKRIRQVRDILIATSGGASAARVARLTHISPKHIQKKLDFLMNLGLLEEEKGIYRSE